LQHAAAAAEAGHHARVRRREPWSRQAGEHARLYRSDEGVLRPLPDGRAGARLDGEGRAATPDGRAPEVAQGRAEGDAEEDHDRLRRTVAARPGGGRLCLPPPAIPFELPTSPQVGRLLNARSA